MGRAALPDPGAGFGLRAVRLGGWRQSAHLTWKVRGLFNRVRSSKRRKNQPQRVQDYVRQARRIAERAQESLEELAGVGAEAGILSEIKYFLDHAERQIEQVERRLLRGETIPQEAKVFSVFEPHTRWCAKGKAGRPVELGVPVGIVESEHGFVLHYKIMWTEQTWRWRSRWCRRRKRCIRSWRDAVSTRASTARGTGRSWTRYWH